MNVNETYISPGLYVLHKTLEKKQTGLHERLKTILIRKIFGGNKGIHLLDDEDPLRS